MVGAASQLPVPGGGTGGLVACIITEKRRGERRGKGESEIMCSLAEHEVPASLVFAEYSVRARKHAESCMLLSVMVHTLNNIKKANSTQYCVVLASGVVRHRPFGSKMPTFSSAANVLPTCH